MTSVGAGPPNGARRRAVTDPSHAPTVRLSLLDGFRLLHDGTPARLPPGLQRVIALITLRPGSTRANLAGLLWPDTPEDHALSSLRTALWRLRRHAHRPVVVTNNTVNLDPTIEVDVDDLVRTAEWVRDGGDPRRAAGLLTVGRHDLLPGWYEDWVLAERERLRQLRLHALEEIARAHLRLGQNGEALQAALEAARAEPLRETPHRLIVEVHLAEGNAYEALHAFYAYRDLILRNLQLEPSAAMCQLVDPLLAPIRQPPNGMPPAHTAGAHRSARPAPPRPG